MSKTFFEVFPTLKLDTGLQDLFENVTVEKVTSTRRKDFLRVYIASDHLIHKEDVFRVEREIGRQFFPNMPVVVKFYEHFTLSSQYDPEKLMDAYRESILLELKEASPVEYSLFRRADVSFSADKLLLTLEDTVFGREKGGELARILEKIYNERCSIPVQVELSYKEKAAGKNREEEERRLAIQVAEISARAGFTVHMKGAELSAGQLAGDPAGGAGQSGSTGQSGAGQSGNAGQSGAGNAGQFGGAGQTDTPGGPAHASLPGGRGGSFPSKKFSGGRDREKGDYKRPLKRSDNPDVIYCRDFEEEAMPIEDIICEIGEVVISGLVIRKD